MKKADDLAIKEITCKTYSWGLRCNLNGILLEQIDDKRCNKRRFIVNGNWRCRRQEQKEEVESLLTRRDKLAMVMQFILRHEAIKENSSMVQAAIKPHFIIIFARNTIDCATRWGIFRFFSFSWSDCYVIKWDHRDKWIYGRKSFIFGFNSNFPVSCAIWWQKLENKFKTLKVAPSMKTVPVISMHNYHNKIVFDSKFLFISTYLDNIVFNFSLQQKNPEKVSHNVQKTS